MDENKVLQKEIRAERKLIKLAQKDKKYFGDLYTQHYPAILGYIKKRIENKEISEDLTSKAFEKALKGLANFQWQGVSFRAWLFRIARNVLNDYFREMGRRPKDVSWEEIAPMIKDKGLKPEDIAIRDTDELSLYELMAELDSEDQYLLYYKFFENLTNVEIAQIMNLSETNVGTKLYRIRNKMKEKLGKETGRN
jgi:RNA polymerase sigma-70 factor (ECF subfamily)